MRLNECNADRSLIQEIELPERPTGQVRIRDILEAWRTMTDDIRADNGKKGEFLIQWEKCR